MVGFEARTQQGAALRPTSHFVYESIYTAILEKRLAPAAKLSKETLGQIFRVSNGTIQRALTRLAEDGAVVMPPKEVASVARPDERQARQVLDARQVGGQAVLGRQSRRPTPWLTERHGYGPTCRQRRPPGRAPGAAGAGRAP
ncbi:GntR family transcriptional regulator, partial [Pseudomonas aeruginosa]|uniref:GntR family transcriptional regulator n=1 Tax=Pseudomonas aeruginosa TaxID=287 RepID=UPI0023B1DF92